jgi:hypothetical protein
VVRLRALVGDRPRAAPARALDDSVVADAATGAHVSEARPAVRAVDLVRAPRTVAVEAPPPDVPHPAAPSGLRPVAGPARILDDMQVVLTDVREHVRTGGAPSWTELEDVVERVVLSLTESAELFWLANAPTAPSGLDDLVLHQTRVAILAARIGLDLSYDRVRAAALGMAGALIDVSLWEAPEGLRFRLETLSPEERAIYRAHPTRSAERLGQWGAPESLVETVRQHHEREHGQGFPRQLGGAAIGQDAKIIGLVDAYVGRATPSARRPGLRPHEAVREIVRSKHESFPAALVKILLSEISVFPPGTLVSLNTGETGQVVAVNRNHPLRPRVEVVADSKGNRPASPKTIDLSETPFLYITGPVSESAK